MKNYETLSEAINELTKQGYTMNFNVKDDCIACGEDNIFIHPDEFEIDEVYRFDGMTNPDDESILYAISSKKHNVKGLLVNAFGVYAEHISAELASKLRYH